MPPTKRVLAVTGGLALTGLIAGAILGGLILSGYVIVAGARAPLATDLHLFTIGAMFGGIVGAVLVPIASWTLLRTVPLGRALAEAAAGTFLGSILGGPILFVGPIAGGLVGFVIATLHLRFVVAKRLARRLPPEQIRGDVG